MANQVTIPPPVGRVTLPREIAERLTEMITSGWTGQFVINVVQGEPRAWDMKRSGRIK